MISASERGSGSGMTVRPSGGVYGATIVITETIDELKILPSNLQTLDIVLSVCQNEKPETESCYLAAATYDSSYKGCQ